jgi:hypothetical protein
MLPADRCSPRGRFRQPFPKRRRLPVVTRDGFCEMSHSPSRHKADKHFAALAASEAAKQAEANDRVVASARRVIAAWNARVEAGAPAEFFPTIGTAIASGHYQLNYRCPACGQVGELDLRTVADAHHARAPIYVLIPKLSCKQCCPNPPHAVLGYLMSPADEAAYVGRPLSAFPDGLVRIVCVRCSRSGQYHKTTLLERYGPRIVGPDLLRQVAKCDRRKSMNDPCGARYE